MFLGKITFFCVLLLLTSSVSAQNYETLPKGVRMFFTRNVQSDVKSSYNKSSSETPYQYEINADIENLAQIEDDTVKDVLSLFKEYPDAYNQISLGRHRLEAEANVEVNAYAFAYGVTNRLTAYIGLPIYDARVNLNYKTVQNSSKEKVAEALQKEYGDDWAQTLGNIVDQVYDIDAGIIQSAFVNTLGYDELGSWSGTGLGDMEFGLFYNFLREYKYGMFTRFGGVAPTGYVDDPDIIQDIGFGDGQWDAFVEYGGAYIINKNFILNAETRYTYQFASEKRLRVPISEDIPLSDETATFTEKLGNRLETRVGIEFLPNDWLRVAPTLINVYTEQAEYTSSDDDANRLLALNTESSSRSFRIDTRLTSTNLFQQGRFPLPVQLTFSVQNMLEGRNVPRTDLVEFEFRMFF